MNDQRPWPLRVLLAVANVVVAAFVLADEIARPIYRPAYEALVRLRAIRRLEAWVSRLPPYGALLALAVPFVGVEPLKIIGVYWFGTGHFVLGLATLVFAYLAGFVLVERTYHAGREKLLTIGWFAACIGFVAGIRDRVMASVRSTRAYALAADVAAGARDMAGRAAASVRGLLRRTGDAPGNPPA
jgi:hypothetical protein